MPDYGTARADFPGDDATLGMPKLSLPSVQVNIRGDRLPEPEDNGIRYLRISLDTL